MLADLGGMHREAGADLGAGPPESRNELRPQGSNILMAESDPPGATLPNQVCRAAAAADSLCLRSMRRKAPPAGEMGISAQCSGRKGWLSELFLRL